MLNNPLNGIDALGLDESWWPCDLWLDPYDCGFAPLPIIVGIIWGGGAGAGGANGSGIGPGDFPNGETLGLPNGLTVPPVGIPGIVGLPGTAVGCDFFVCGGQPAGNGYAAAAALALGGPLCVGTGVCEALAIGAGVAAVAVTAYIVYSKISRVSGKERATDVPSWARYQPPRGPNESCGAWAARILAAQYGAGSPMATNRGPGSEYSKIKKACERGGF